MNLNKNKIVSQKPSGAKPPKKRIRKEEIYEKPQQKQENKISSRSETIRDKLRGFYN